MAITLLRPAGVRDVLARVSLAGGIPREITENPIAADWSPDGKTLGLIRTALQRPRSLEFPVGKVLYESPTLREMRISPKGDSIAIADYAPDDNSISVVDLQGRRRPIISGLSLVGAVSWRPDGREMWYSTATGNSPPNIHAVDLRGRSRLVLRSAAWISLHDIAADGRVLMSQNGWRGGIGWSVPGEGREQEASWLDWSVPNDLSHDGKTLLLSEDREGGGPAGSVYLRRNPAEPAVRLGDGEGLALSPDEKWALARSAGLGGKARQLLLLPTGTGEQKALPSGPLRDFFAAAWLPDGKRLIVRASERGKAGRLYLVGLDGGPVQAISAEGANGPIAVSGNGKVAACRVVQEIQIFSLGGSGVRPLPGQAPGEVPVRWTPDGAALYVFRPGPPPVDVFRIDAVTGTRDLWKRLTPPDAAGVEGVARVLITQDAGGYVYGYGRRMSDLYVVDGLK